MIALHTLFCISFSCLLMMGNTPTHANDIWHMLFSKFQQVKLPMVKNSEQSNRKKIISFAQQAASIFALQGLTYKILLKFNQTRSASALDFFYFYLCTVACAQFARLIAHNIAVLNETEEYVHAQNISSFALMGLITYDLFQALKNHQEKSWSFFS